MNARYLTASSKGCPEGDDEREREREREKEDSRMVRESHPSCPRDGLIIARAGRLRVALHGGA
jgi:ferredoxin